MLVDEPWSIVAEQVMSLGWMARSVWGATVTEEHVATMQKSKARGEEDAAAVGGGRAEEHGHADDDALDDTWKTVHTPPR